VVPALTAATLTALIFLCLAWELWLAPLRPGGSMLALKAVPLLVPIFGVMRKNRYTYQWSSMLILAYFAEGAVRGFAEQGLARSLALTEVLLSVICFSLAVTFSRTGQESKPRTSGTK
jgi:uncharacterized membrane protein